TTRTCIPISRCWNAWDWSPARKMAVPMSPGRGLWQSSGSQPNTQQRSHRWAGHEPQIGVWEDARKGRGYTSALHPDHPPERAQIPSTCALQTSEQGSPPGKTYANDGQDNRDYMPAILGHFGVWVQSECRQKQRPDAQASARETTATGPPAPRCM